MFPFSFFFKPVPVLLKRAKSCFYIAVQKKKVITKACCFGHFFWKKLQLSTHYVAFIYWQLVSTLNKSQQHKVHRHKKVLSFCFSLRGTGQNTPHNSANDSNGLCWYVTSKMVNCSQFMQKGLAKESCLQISANESKKQEAAYCAKPEV